MNNESYKPQSGPSINTDEISVQDVFVSAVYI